MILQVSGASDPAVSPYRHICDPDWLVANGLFVAEGRLVVDRLISAGRHRIESLLVTQAAFKALEQRLTVLDVPVFIAPPALLNEITGFNFHRGCLALAAREIPRALNDVITGGLLLGLEAVGTGAADQSCAPTSDPPGQRRQRSGRQPALTTGQQPSALSARPATASSR